MNKLKTIEILEKYYSIIESHDESNEAYEFIHNFELEIVKSMLSEFDSAALYKIAKILLVMSEAPKICNYTSPMHHSDYVGTGITIG